MASCFNGACHVHWVFAKIPRHYSQLKPINIFIRLRQAVQQANGLRIYSKTINRFRGFAVHGSTSPDFPIRFGDVAALCAMGFQLNAMCDRHCDMLAIYGPSSGAPAISNGKCLPRAGIHFSLAGIGKVTAFSLLCSFALRGSECSLCVCVSCAVRQTMLGQPSSPALLLHGFSRFSDGVSHVHVTCNFPTVPP